MLPFETTSLPSEDEEEIDPFAELEIGTEPAYQGGKDPLTLFEDDDDDPLSAFSEEEGALSDFVENYDEDVVSFDEKDVPDLKNGSASSKNPAESTYKLLLETVWVDDILDPSEVKLLARKRGELGLSFERHLQLVREIIGG